MSQPVGELPSRFLQALDVSVEPFHMFRYLDEQSFRFNERYMNDQERFLMAMKALWIAA
jgi:hypothetical protein